MNLREKIKRGVEKTRKLPLWKKKIIFWTIISLTAVFLFYLYLKDVESQIRKFNEGEGWSFPRTTLQKEKKSSNLEEQIEKVNQQIEEINNQIEEEKKKNQKEAQKNNNLPENNEQNPGQQ